MSNYFLEKIPTKMEILIKAKLIKNMDIIVIPKEYLNPSTTFHFDSSFI